MVETADFSLSFPFVFYICYTHNLSCATKPKNSYSYIWVFTPYIITCYWKVLKYNDSSNFKDNAIFKILDKEIHLNKVRNNKVN